MNHWKGLLSLGESGSEANETFDTLHLSSLEFEEAAVSRACCRVIAVTTVRGSLQRISDFGHEKLDSFTS